MNFIIDALIFEYFGRPKAQLDPKSHQMVEIIIGEEFWEKLAVDLLKI